MKDKMITMTAKQAEKAFPHDEKWGARMQKTSRKEPSLSDPDSPELPDAPKGILAGFVGRLRGRPRKPNPMRRIDLMLDPGDIEYLRSTGRGWQTRLREYVRNGIGAGLL